MRFLILTLLTTAGIASNSQASPVVSDVEAACKAGGANDVEVIDLKYRDREENLRRIASHEFGQSKISVYLKEFYSAHPDGESKSKEELADQGNQRLLPASALKDRALKYSTEEQKIADPMGYRQALIESYNDLMPAELNDLSWFLNLKDPIISSTSIEPADRSKLGDFWGAKSTLKADDKRPGKKIIQILFSNNASEALPYLIPLIAHELQHSRTQFSDRMKIRDHDTEYADIIVDEARAFDLQMRAYLALVKRDPQTFCNWLYISWSYGDLLIPLSWTMASMESEMEAGRYIFEYAKKGQYGGERYLLNQDGSALRPDIQKRITDLHLRYVK